MPKYRVVFEDSPQDELYDTFDEAVQAALDICAEAQEGAEILHLSNPGDYDYDENTEYDYEIEEIGDDGESTFWILT